MIWLTHVVFSLFVGLFFQSYFSINAYAYFLLLAFAALLPDIDKRNSKIGNKVKPVSFFVEKTFGHRGVFHSIFVPILLAYGFSFYNLQFAQVFFIGYMSHLVADSFTKMGINYFHPLTTFRIKGFVQTGSMVEYIILFGLVVSSFYLL